MRIAQVTPCGLHVSPDAGGPSGRMVFALADELLRRGHQLTIFTESPGARNGNGYGGFRGARSRPVPGALAAHVAPVEELVGRSAEFDVIHSHVDYLPWLAGHRIQAPLVTTLHARLDRADLRRLLALDRGWPLVSVSRAQRRPVDDLGLNWVATVYHGLDLVTPYPFGSGAGGYLLFTGEIAPQHDVATAIRVAIRAGMRLKISAGLHADHRGYFETGVRPLLDHPLIEWVGEADAQARAALLGGAAAMLLPIDCEEPLGLTFIEALATGTPVISRPRGCVPELVVHGEHGFTVWSEDEMVDACRGVTGLDRRACRRRAVERFSVERMVGDYENLYQTLGADRSPVRLRPGLTLTS
jgi:glycosyltransferase involved in cell wall biosynthesis